MSQATITERVVEALEHNGFLTTASVAAGLRCGRDQVVAAYDEIEAAGLKLMRVRGSGGGAEFLGKRMRGAR